ncbi:hypothetical protein ONZ45_g4619 [Pleurotus djamor]|nr:hypothetical protein ONZ45_g4619 [Pleurotus djamor]
MSASLISAIAEVALKKPDQEDPLLLASHWGRKTRIEYRYDYPTINVELSLLNCPTQTILLRSEYILALRDTIALRATVIRASPPATDDAPAQLPDDDTPTLSEQQARLLTSQAATSGIIIRGSPATVLMEYQVPFFFQADAHSVFFVCKQGVYTLGEQEFGIVAQRNRAELKHMFWLFDSTPRSLTPWDRCLNIVYIVEAASSRKARFSWAQKSDLQIKSWFVAPPTLGEATVCARLSGVDVQTAKIVYAYFGPSLRLIKSLINTEACNIHLSRLSDEISRITAETVSRAQAVLSGGAVDVADNELSHQLFLLVPTNNRHSVTATIMSSFIAYLVHTRLIHVAAEVQTSFFELCVKYTPARALAGCTFEGAMHERLHYKSPWPLRAFATTQHEHVHFSMPDALSAPIIRSLITSPFPSISIGNAATLPVSVLPLPIIIFTGPELKAKALPQKTAYYRPAASNQASFDSFIYNLNTNALFVFQFTLSPEHGAKKSGFDQLLDQFPGATLNLIVVSCEQQVKLIAPQDVAPLFDSIHFCLVDRIEGLASGTWSQSSQPLGLDDPLHLPAMNN